MQPQGSRVPLSVLDLAVLAQGMTSSDALGYTTRLAQHAEEFGYSRFWVAEHHNMPNIASTNPPVLIAHLAAHTKSILVGSGGVMLPNHPPLVVAEQFALLEALYPGRIDLGIGRAPGTDPATAAALRRSPATLGAEEFPRHLVELMGLLGDKRMATGMWDRFIATPVPTSSPNIILLGSSDYSAQLAAQLGLPFAFAHHFDMGGTLMAVDLYRENFQPSAVLSEPYTIVTASVFAADSLERAEYLAAPSQLATYHLRTGRRFAYATPEQALAHPDFEAAKRAPSSKIIGSPEMVVKELEQLQKATEASELMLNTFMTDFDDRVHCLELIAKAWF